ncbi:MAG: hypothetical protein MUC50_00900 [Myxococcota bacterium]|jgi:hypothetical protein|nr:hypothetical protein [Myxococcota bacterium]
MKTSKPKRTWAIVALCLLTGAGVACQKQPKGPTIETSSSSSEYALIYPDEVRNSSAKFDTLSEEAKNNTATLASYSGAPEIEGKLFAADVLESASNEGRSEVYVSAAQEDEAVERFFEDERDDLTRRVSGSVQASLAKQSGEPKPESGDNTVSGAVSYGLKEGVKKSLENRLRERSDAAMLIESNKEALGKKGAEALQAQADMVAHTAYLVEVALPELKLKLLRLSEQAKDVQNTLDEELEGLSELLEDSALSKEERASLEARKALVMEARQQLDGALRGVTKTEESMQKTIDELQKSYEDTMEALLRDLRKQGETETSAKPLPRRGPRASA